MQKKVSSQKKCIHIHTYIHTNTHTSKRTLRGVQFCIIVYFCFLLVLFLFVLFNKEKVGKKGGVIFVKETRPLNIDIVQGEYFPATLNKEGKREQNKLYLSCNFVSSVFCPVFTTRAGKVYSVLEVY